MNSQYNFSRQEAPPASRPATTVLAIDTGSPIASVAVSVDTELTAVRSVEQRQSSGKILQLIDEALTVSDMRLSEVELLIGLRGPGSFTGLRVGLATLQGMRWALGLQAGTLPTLQVLATLAPVDATRVISCVDGLRGEWLTQEHAATPPHTPVEEPRVSTAAELTAESYTHFIGFGVTRLREAFEDPSAAVFIEPGPLAPQTVRALETCPPNLDPGALASPLYIRPPAVTLTGPRRS